jgi:hypothetical protein
MYAEGHARAAAVDAGALGGWEWDLPNEASGGAGVHASAAFRPLAPRVDARLSVAYLSKVRAGPARGLPRRARRLSSRRARRLSSRRVRRHRLARAPATPRAPRSTRSPPQDWSFSSVGQLLPRLLAAHDRRRLAITVLRSAASPRAEHCAQLARAPCGAWRGAGHGQVLCLNPGDGSETRAELEARSESWVDLSGARGLAIAERINAQGPTPPSFSSSPPPSSSARSPEPRAHAR